MTGAKGVLDAGAERLLELVARLYIAALGEMLDVFHQPQRHRHAEVGLQQ